MNELLGWNIVPNELYLRDNIIIMEKIAVEPTIIKCNPRHRKHA